MAGRKSALCTTIRPHLPGPKEIGKYLLKEWRQHPTKVAVGVLALDETDRTHFMRTLGTFRPDETVSVELDPIFEQMKKNGSAKFALWITHPDGDPRPSPFDNYLMASDRVRALAADAGVPMVDLVVVGFEAFYSWAIHGWDPYDFFVRRSAT